MVVRQRGRQAVGHGRSKQALGVPTSAVAYACMSQLVADVFECTVPAEFISNKHAILCLTAAGPLQCYRKLWHAGMVLDIKVRRKAPGLQAAVRSAHLRCGLPYAVDQCTGRPVLMIG